MRLSLARLDRNLTWSYIYRPQATQNFRFAQPQELADGSLIVVVRRWSSTPTRPPKP